MTGNSKTGNVGLIRTKLAIGEQIAYYERLLGRVWSSTQLDGEPFSHADVASYLTEIARLRKGLDNIDTALDFEDGRE